MRAVEHAARWQSPSAILSIRDGARQASSNPLPSSFHSSFCGNHVSNLRRIGTHDPAQIQSRQFRLSRSRGPCAVYTGAAGSRSGAEAKAEGQWRLYVALGVEKDVSVGEVKVAYRQLARMYHPDVCPPESVEECVQRFLEIQNAYEVLSDPVLRARYDYEQAHPSVALRRGASNVGRPWQKGRRPWEAMRPQEWASAQEREETVSEWRAQVEGQLSGLKARAAAKQALRRQQQEQQERAAQQRATESCEQEEMFYAYDDFAS